MASEGFERAIELLDAELVDEAVSALRDAVRADPRDATLLVKAGDILTDADACKEAIPFFREAARLDPTNARAHNGLGLALEESDEGSLDEVAREYREAIRLDPDFHDARLNLAEALAERDQWEEAIAAYHEALKRKPDGYTRLELADILERRGRADEAVSQYRDILLGPREEDPPVARALLRLEALKTPGAEAALSQFEALGRRKPGYYWVLKWTPRVPAIALVLVGGVIAVIVYRANRPKERPPAAMVQPQPAPARPTEPAGPPPWTSSSLGDFAALGPARLQPDGGLIEQARGLDEMGWAESGFVLEGPFRGDLEAEAELDLRASRFEDGRSPDDTTLLLRMEADGRLIQAAYSPNARLIYDQNSPKRIAVPAGANSVKLKLRRTGDRILLLGGVDGPPRELGRFDLSEHVAGAPTDKVSLTVVHSRPRPTGGDVYALKALAVRCTDPGGCRRGK